MSTYHVHGCPSIHTYTNTHTYTKHRHTYTCSCTCTCTSSSTSGSTADHSRSYHAPQGYREWVRQQHLGFTRTCLAVNILHILALSLRPIISGTMMDLGDVAPLSDVAPLFIVLVCDVAALLLHLRSPCAQVCVLLNRLHACSLPVDTSSRCP